MGSSLHLNQFVKNPRLQTQDTFETELRRYTKSLCIKVYVGVCLRKGAMMWGKKWNMMKERKRD